MRMEMREIKFRMWLKKDKKLVKVSSIDWWGNKIFDLSSDDRQVTEGELSYGINDDNRSQFILMQYTGLKDKNGAEIWEGDIGITPCIHMEHIWYVGFIHGAFNLVYKYQEGGLRQTKFFNLSEFYENCEVIGNIYENPELLDDKV
jgi:uncharacterized phage protein (TIGR01671 family)